MRAVAELAVRLPSQKMEDPGGKDGVWLGHVELGGREGRHSSTWLDVGTRHCWEVETGAGLCWLPQAKPQSCCT